VVLSSAKFNVSAAFLNGFLFLNELEVADAPLISPPMNSPWAERNERNKEFLQQKALTLQHSRERIDSLQSLLHSAKVHFQELSHRVKTCSLIEERASLTWKIASGRASTDKADAESATRDVTQKQISCDAAAMRDKLSSAGNDAKRKNDQRLLHEELLALKRIEARLLDTSDVSEDHLLKSTRALADSRSVLAAAIIKKEEAENEIERLVHEIDLENAASNDKEKDYQIARENFSVSTPTLEPRHIRAKALTSTFLLRENSISSSSSSILPSSSSSPSPLLSSPFLTNDALHTSSATKATSFPNSTNATLISSTTSNVNDNDGDDFVIGIDQKEEEEEMDKLPFKVRPREPVGPCFFQPVAKPMTLRGLGNLSLSATEPVAALARLDYAAYDNSMLMSSPRRPVTVASALVSGIDSKSTSGKSRSSPRRVPMVPENLSSADGDLAQLRLLRTEMESSLSALQTATKDLEAFALKNPRDIDAIDAVTRSRATARRYLKSLEDVSKTFTIVANDVEKAVRPPTSSARDIGRHVPDFLNQSTNR